MSSVIVELQREALNKNTSVADLLRKSLIVSRKLKLDDFKEWIENELNGYKGEVPEYREVHGIVRGWNPYNGWIPLIFEDPKDGDLYSKRGHSQSIAELENLLNSKSTLHMPFPQNIQRELSRGFGFETNISLFVDSSALVKTIDAVRNIILNWSLKLEEEGILGEGLSFSDAEKEMAIQSPQNINNYYGTIQNSQIQQGNREAIQVASTFQLDPDAVSSFLQILQKELSNINVSQDGKSEIESDIATVRAQINSPKPKKGIIKESLCSIKNVLEGASGSAVGHLLIEVGKIILS